MSEPVYVIGYARVSTSKQAVEGGGLEDQEKAIKHFVKHEGWKLYKDEVFKEPFTGTTADRPVYKAIVQLIRDNPGKFKYVVIKVIDRMSREGSYAYQQMKRELDALGVQIRDVAGVIQASVNTLAHLDQEYKWSKRNPGHIGEMVMAEMGNEERSTILTRLIGAEIALVKDGYHIGPSDDGFISEQIFDTSKKKHIQVPDPKRAHFFQEMFKLRAEGIYSDPEIVEHINALGYTSKVHRRWSKDRTKVIGHTEPKKLTVKKLQRIIQRPVYAGIIREKWTKYQPIKAKYDGLVDIGTFNKANRGKVFILDNQNGSYEMLFDFDPDKAQRRRPKYRSDFLYKNVILCPICHKPLHASFSRSRSKEQYGFYHCTRKHSRYAIAKDVLDKEYKTYLSKIKFKEDFFTTFEKVLLLKYRKEEGDASRRTMEANTNVADLELRKANLIDAYASTEVVAIRRGLEDRIEALEVDIRLARRKRDELEVNENDIHSFVAHAKKLLEHPMKILENVVNEQEQLGLYGLVFDTFPTYEELTIGTPKLSLVFELSQSNEGDEALMVRLQDLSWNTIEQTVQKWNNAFGLLNARQHYGLMTTQTLG